MQRQASDSADRDAVLAVLKEWGISDDVITKHEGLSPSAKFHKPKNLAELIELGKSMGAKPKDLAKAPEIARKFGIPDN